MTEKENPKDALQEFLQVAVKMREAQKNYFLTRSGYWLGWAQHWEMHFDKLLNQVTQ